MNWYKKSKPVEFLLKIASQDQWDKYIGDFQRWVIDAVEIKVFLTKTDHKITVTLNLWNGHLGEMMWQDFWRFELNEMAAAKKLFKDISKKAEELSEKFKDEEIPNNLLHAYLRTELRDIESDHLPRTNIPTINYSLNESYAPDWRSTIYGNRYPTRDTSAF